MGACGNAAPALHMATGRGIAALVSLSRSTKRSLRASNLSRKRANLSGVGIGLTLVTAARPMALGGLGTRGLETFSVGAGTRSSSGGREGRGSLGRLPSLSSISLGSLAIYRLLDSCYNKRKMGYYDFWQDFWDFWLPLFLVVWAITSLVKRIFGLQAAERMGQFFGFLPIALLFFYAITLAGLSLFHWLGWL